MKIKKIGGNSQGAAWWGQVPMHTPAKDIAKAIQLTIAKSGTTTSEITSQLTKHLRTTAGWDSTEFKQFHSVQQPSGSGRQIAIDARFKAENVCVEIELSNQTAFSHDLLKIQTANIHKVCDVGVVIALTNSERLKLSKSSTSYLTFEKAAYWLQIYSHLNFPIVLLGIER